MRESWTDERLDHFSARVDERFDDVDRRLGRIEFEMRETRTEIGGIRARLDSMQRMMFHGVIALSAAIVAGFGGMAGLLAVVV